MSKEGQSYSNSSRDSIFEEKNIGTKLNLSDLVFPKQYDKTYKPVQTL